MSTPILGSPPLPPIIGLVGRIGSGKDTVGKMLAKHGYTCMSFAAPLKEICKSVFDFTEEQVNGSQKQKETGDPRYVRADGSLLTPRFAMQTLGTEWGRNCCPTLWTELGMRRARALSDAVVFTDARFLTEAKAIREAGGQVWRVVRPEKEAGASHISETEMNGWEMGMLLDRVIMNDSHLMALSEKVREALSGVQPIDAHGVQPIDALGSRSLLAYTEPRPVHFWDGVNPNRSLGCGVRPTVVQSTTDLSLVTCPYCKEHNTAP